MNVFKRSDKPLNGMTKLVKVNSPGSKGRQFDSLLQTVATLYRVSMDASKLLYYEHEKYEVILLVFKKTTSALQYEQQL